MANHKKWRVYGRPLKSFLNFFYHYSRYCRYAAWKSDMSRSSDREYHVIKVYHSLEKSMSYKQRRPGAGWKDARYLLELLLAAEKAGNITEGDRAARTALEKFIEMDGNFGTPEADEIALGLRLLSFGNSEPAGVVSMSSNDLWRGRLESPESFFMSRYSLREFDDKPVAKDVVERAVELSIKTPSVCNRQPWHVYVTSDPFVIEKALALQNGNRGFGHKVPNLAVLCIDLRAFMAADESYQHWIDGGLFSMSFIYALHSLGVASCCLNWSASPNQDKALRDVVNIQPSHSIVMMLAFGEPADRNIVCASRRKGVSDVLSVLNATR